MTKSQRIQMKISELRERVNRLPSTKDNIPALEEARSELAGMESEYRAAVEEEDRETGGASFDSGETAEVRGLIHRASAAGIISAVALHRVSDGAEGELQRALGVGGDVVPWQLMEKRAAATFTANTGEASLGRFTGKAFADSIAEFVGCMVVQVPSGEADYPILGTGASVEYQTDSTGVTESTAAFNVEKLTPRNRYQASFAVREQDLIAFSGAGEAVTEELRAATRDRLDQDLMTKAAEGLFTVKTGANPSTPSSASSYENYLASLFGAVDGIHAGDVSQTRLVVDKETYAHMGATTATGTSDSVAEKVREIAQVRVTPHAASGTNFRDAVVAKMGKAPNAVMALFGGGVRILEDPFTRAAEGERRFHGVLFGDLTVLRAAAYDRHRFRLA